MGSLERDENKPARLSNDVRAQMADHETFEQRQLSVKEVAAPGDDCDRK
jgi:hypothetical protein